MTAIRERLALAGTKLRGSASEGVRVALEVLDQCNCGTCFYFSDQLLECSYPFGMRNPKPSDHCSRWEAKS